MSDWTVHLEFEEGNSSKFWRARVEGKTLYVNYGKIGSNGQTQVKDLADPAAAKKEYDKLVAEKRRQAARTEPGHDVARDGRFSRTLDALERDEAPCGERAGPIGIPFISCQFTNRHGIAICYTAMV